MQVEILAQDRDSKCNRDLVAFLKSNLAELVRAGVIFRFSVVEKHQFQQLKARGITALPAAIVSGRPIMGMLPIRREIMALVRDEQPIQQPRQEPFRPIKPNASDYDAIVREEMTLDAKERDDKEDNVSGEYLRERAAREAEKRQKTQPGTSVKAKPQPTEDIRASADTNNEDDRMMLQMLENSIGL